MSAFDTETGTYVRTGIIDENGVDTGVDPFMASFLEQPSIELFRNRMRGACPTCEKRELCMGGCPLMPEIVFCNSDKRQI